MAWATVNQVRSRCGTSLPFHVERLFVDTAHIWYNEFMEIASGSGKEAPSKGMRNHRHGESEEMEE